MKNKKLLLGIGIICCLWCLPKIVHGKENRGPFSLVELKCENMVNRGEGGLMAIGKVEI